MTVSKFKKSYQNIAFLILNFAFLITSGFAQETPPSPSAPREVKIPNVLEKKLPNGLTVVVAERKNVPLVNIQILVDGGITSDDIKTAGLANMTVNLLNKGTKTRSSTQISEEIEFLGAELVSNVGIDDSMVSVNVKSDKVNEAVSILSDIIRNPTFPLKEVELAKSQTIDRLKTNMNQPGFLAEYVASVYSFYLTPEAGTPESIRRMTKKGISDFYRENYIPDNAILMFVGDISSQQALKLANDMFGNWKNPPRPNTVGGITLTQSADAINETKREEMRQPLLKRILVIDLPNSGQAAVSFVKHLQFVGRINWNDEIENGEFVKNYFTGIVFNSILGGGYSSRLNQEIRIKRGLSYGAGSNISWRSYDSRFSARTQTKNESAGEVAKLVLSEIEKIETGEITVTELASRQAVVTGDFGRDLSTNAGFQGILTDLYSNWQSVTELNSVMKNVSAVTEEEVKQFAAENLKGGDIIIVGDYKIFAADLKKRFPNQKVEVIPASELDLNRDDLRKIKVKSKK